MKKKQMYLSFIVVLILLNLLPFLIVKEVKGVTQYEVTFYPSSSSGFIYQNQTPYGNSTGEAKCFADNGYEGAFPIAQWKIDTTYRIYRSYIDFNTASLPDGCDIVSAILWVAVLEDYSTVDFYVRAYSGFNQWSNSTYCNWTDCSINEGVFFYTGTVQLDYYYSNSLYESSISKTGHTQFRLINTNEGIAPTTPQQVILHEWNNTQFKPKLDVTYTLDVEEEPTERVFDLFSLDDAVGDALGTEPFIGGLILSCGIIFTLLECLAIAEAPMLYSIIIVIAVAGLMSGLGWLPAWLIIVEVMAIVAAISIKIGEFIEK